MDFFGINEQMEAEIMMAETPLHAYDQSDESDCFESD